MAWNTDYTDPNLGAIDGTTIPYASWGSTQPSGDSPSGDTMSNGMNWDWAGNLLNGLGNAAVDATRKAIGLQPNTPVYRTPGQAGVSISGQAAGQGATVAGVPTMWLLLAAGAVAVIVLLRD